MRVVYTARTYMTMAGCYRPIYTETDPDVRQASGSRGQRYECK